MTVRCAPYCNHVRARAGIHLDGVREPIVSGLRRAASTLCLACVLYVLYVAYVMDDFATNDFVSADRGVRGNENSAYARRKRNRRQQEHFAQSLEGGWRIEAQHLIQDVGSRLRRSYAGGYQHDGGGERKGPRHIQT